MRLSKIGEFGLIQKLRRRCRSIPPEILTGIGDDAAVIKQGNKNILVTTDMMLEGVHFDLSFTTFYQLGYKFLAVNASDIFAMGGSPKYFFISLGIPGDYRTDYIDELYSGIFKFSKKFGITIAGGDTCSSANGLVLSGTLLGSADRIVARAGAKEGDGIFVTDTLGDSAMGLMLLRGQKKKIQNSRLSESPMATKLIRKHLMPETAPLTNTSGITSMIDISDGLLIDLSHICDESKVGATIYRDRIPVSRELSEISKAYDIDPVRLALKGGEDYALLFTAPADIRTTAFRIGEITPKGRFIIDEKGGKNKFRPEGYEHFRRKDSSD